MILAFTGAGISKASGIPTFDEMGDLRSKLDRDFARRHPEEFIEIMNKLKDTCSKANPNDAHKVLAEYNVPVITMNIDDLHKKALSEIGKGELADKLVVEVHGNLFKDNVVLYGDQAPKYQKAYNLCRKLRYGDTLIIVGTSYYTSIASTIKMLAQCMMCDIVEINEDAEHKVREYIESNLDKLGDYNEFFDREELY